ncbi:PH domain-containing protein [Microbacterium sp. Sa4CUA7]|uniref:PH domain-containing protein n=1 Tax=Microbacterium pullorum TaxID=2762236 RepID=A0ABR8S4E7_9MICO|nr:PH domain-containing protein [Microbacterium pullorum]MBD7958367.1 PH domain-containing protein [Microbacterium pullorum]
MTNPPPPGPTPLPPTTDAGEVQATGTPGIDATLDAGTYRRLIEPRSPGRLALEGGVWHQISRKYLWEQLLSYGMVLVIVIVAALVVGLALQQTWVFIPGGIAAVILVWTIAVLPRQVRAIGYQLRDDDLVFRRGILWQRMVAVPYGRMQLVDITHGPLDRGFGVAQLKLVTAAATTGVTIPGLSQQAAEALRDHLIAVAESRRTGL